ncbi:3'(2'),5'-bisphosphate nucleotidase CysQ family protein [Coraliomargarita sp. W4R53]
MILDIKALNFLADEACEAARLAGALIRTYTAGKVAVSHKEGGDSLASQVVTEVDEGSQAVILQRLQGTMAQYDLALLTEELSDDGSRFSKDYFWCIDPMDGTLPFTQGKPGYAVAIALVRQDGASMIGVVYDPVKDRLYRAVSGLGLRVNGQPYQAHDCVDNDGASLRFCMDCTFETDPRRSELTVRMNDLAQRAGYSGALIEINGGAVCNACYVLEHSPAVYLKEPKPELGGGSFWDFAATACIFQEAGASVSDYFGECLELNSQTHTFFNHCGVCFCSGPELAELVQAALPR